jgi:hypothetical protein
MKTSLKVLYTCAAILMASGATIATSSAMPAGPALVGMQQNSAAPLVQNVGWRCGPGRHVNGWGRCVPNGWRGGWHRRWRRW